MWRWIVLIGLLIISGCTTKQTFNKPLTEQVTIIAHRGASGYEKPHSVAAYDLALAMGADYIEMDVQQAKDGTLVIAHDDQSNALLFEPTLQHYRNTCIYIEIKQPTAASVATFERAITKLAPTCIVIQSFEEQALSSLQQYPLIWLVPKKQIGQVPKFAKQVGINEQYLTRKLVAQYHEQNIAVYAYTVNTTKRFEELLRYGIDGIFTDYPDQMLEIRTKKAPQ
ncbi:Glycerophosphoryl diester phosphodiesterase precursor [Metalysinibacillus saudimassiliensis]|uniref:Glycerophosphoryl diester phosphodiesterase n=1 Tax=Metalysinibacillus saudimassiliensis TaxID=1461583 RepID=A0A078MA75_9BACL|nr:Glycerophosphoryl diester phosphodiesterase precursor [Metalysinibacillus saudimassiliensis]